MSGRAPVVRGLHLAAQLPGTASGEGGGGGGGAGAPAEQLDFEAYVRLARTAERGLFDFLLLAESGAAGGPEPFTVLNALAAVTERIGLAGSSAVSSGAASAADEAALARRIASLDRLSAGRAGWHRAGTEAAAAGRAGGVPGGPVLIRTGGDAGEYAADVVLTGPGALEPPGLPGRDRHRPGGPRILRRVTVVLGDTDAAAAERALSARESTAGTPAGAPLAGTAATVAAALEAYVRSGAADGFFLLPGSEVGGLAEFVDQVVPLLQERESFRTAYRGRTLREHLGT